MANFSIPIYFSKAFGDNVTGDGTSVATAYESFDASPAKALVEAGASQTYNLVFLYDTDESITIDITGQTLPLIDEAFVKISFMNWAYASGTGDFVTFTNATNDVYGVWFVGARISDYTNAFVTNQFLSATVFELCHITNTNINTRRAGKSAYINSFLKNCSIGSIEQISVSTQFRLHHVVGCTFINVVCSNGLNPLLGFDPSDGTFGNTNGLQEAITQNNFKNINFAISIRPTSGAYIDLKNNNYEGCNGTFIDNPVTVPLPNIGNVVPFNSVAAMRAEYFSVFGVSTTLYENETFKSVPVDTFDFPTDKTVNYKNRHQGANRYALSQVTPLANADYDFVTDHYVSNKLTPIPLVYELTATRAGKLRRLELQFVRTGNTEQLGASGEVEITLEKSTDGVNFTSIGTFLSGIDSTTLDFDYVLEVGKSYRASIQPVGAAFGEIEFYGMVGEMLTLEDELSQTDLREVVAAGTIPSKVVTLYNQAHGAGALSDFTQAVENNQFVKNNGLLVTGDNQYYTSQSVGSITDLTVMLWLNSVPAINYPEFRFCYLISNFDNVANDGYSFFIFRTNTNEVKITANIITGGVGSGISLTISETEFDELLYNKWGVIYLTLNSSIGTKIIGLNDITGTNAYAGSVDVSTLPLTFGRIPTLSDLTPTYFPQGVRFESPKVYLDKALTQSEIIENIKADQYIHEHLR